MGADLRPARRSTGETRGRVAVNAAGAASVVLRHATQQDVADVAALERLCYGDPWPASAFVSLPENPAVVFLVARDGDGEGQLAGYAIAWRVLEEGELANLAVDPSARRCGIGGRLLDATLEELGRREVKAVYLEVRESNTGARMLYASRGFAAVGRRARYYRAPEEDALVLRYGSAEAVSAAR